MQQCVTLLAVHARKFRVNALGWRRFCESIGVDGDALVAGNDQGVLLRFCAKRMSEIPPEAEPIFRRAGVETERPEDVEAEYRSWRRLLEKATSEPPLFEDAGKSGKA